MINTIGCKICNLRKQNNMSQEQLAEKLNVSRQSISKWERDEALPDICNLEAISNIFGVTIDSLVKKDEDVKATVYLNKSIVSVIDTDTIKLKINTVTILTCICSVVTTLIALWGDSLDFINDGTLAALAVLIFILAPIPTLIIYRGVLKDRLFEASENNGKRKPIIVNSTISHIFISLALTSILEVGILMGLWIMIPTIILVLCLCAVIIRGIQPKKKQEDQVYQGGIKMAKETIEKMKIAYRRADILLVSSLILYSLCVLIYLYNYRMYISIDSNFKYSNYISMFTFLAGAFILATAMILFQWKYRERIKDNYLDKVQQKKSGDDYLLSILSSFALIILLISGFAFNTWHPTWIVMPISGLLALIINSIRNKKEKEKTDDEPAQALVED